ncbi:MAG: hypothetical protein KJ709_01125 [Nanoarchaeota archaeon]|nr:hypothetical protein [Nanoarchaeota archaeon]
MAAKMKHRPIETDLEARLRRLMEETQLNDRLRASGPSEPGHVPASFRERHRDILRRPFLYIFTALSLLAGAVEYRDSSGFQAVKHKIIAMQSSLDSGIDRLVSSYETYKENRDEKKREGEAKKKYDDKIREGWGLVHKGQYKAAIEKFKLATYHDLNRADAYHGMGYASIQLGDNENSSSYYYAAIKYYEKAIGLDPKQIYKNNLDVARNKHGAIERQRVYEMEWVQYYSRVDHEAFLMINKLGVGRSTQDYIDARERAYNHMKSAINNEHPPDKDYYDSMESLRNEINNLKRQKR